MSIPNWWGDWRPNLTPHTGNLQATDLIECTSIVGGLPVNTAITGAQIIAAASSGATWGSITGTLSSQTDLQSALNAKQDTLVSGTNIKTINGNSILGSGNLTISGSNIYNADGTLTAARTLTQGGFDLTIAGTTSSRFFSNGNVGIGTTTNAGYKLDVNGTARVQNTLTATANTSNGCLVINQNGVGFAAQIINRVNTINAMGMIQFSDQKTGAGNRSFGLGIGRSGDPSWANGDFIFSYYSGSGGWQQSAKIFNASGNWAIENGSGTTDITTALLQVNSTTKGFLPPRMTNAQMLAIAAPAVGLVVYDTTNNKHCGYNGTAWQNFY